MDGATYSSNILPMTSSSSFGTSWRTMGDGGEGGVGASVMVHDIKKESVIRTALAL